MPKVIVKAKPRPVNWEQTWEVWQYQPATRDSLIAWGEGAVSAHVLDGEPILIVHNHVYEVDEIVRAGDWVMRHESDEGRDWFCKADDVERLVRTYTMEPLNG